MRCISLFALLGVGAFASPVIKRQSAPPDPGTPCLYLTTDINWGGEAQNICKPGGTCVDIPGELAHQVSSAGPEDGYKCFLYDEPGCKGGMSYPLAFPGNADLHTVGTFVTNHFSPFDNRARSFMCSKAENQGFALATRDEANANTLSRRGSPVCLWLSTEKNFGGVAQRYCGDSSRCYNLQDALAGKVSSAGPDVETSCYLYSGKDCQGGASDELLYPGAGDLSTVGTLNVDHFVGFDNRANSYWCMSTKGLKAKRDGKPLPASLEAQPAQSPCLYLSTEKNFGGDPQLLCRPINRCNNIDADLAGKVNSAGPDAYSICWLYSGLNCTGKVSDKLVYPGSGDVSTLATQTSDLQTLNHSVNWDKSAFSFFCSNTNEPKARRDEAPLPEAEIDTSTNIALSSASSANTDPCLYITSEKNWKGASQKLCARSGYCGQTSLIDVNSAGADGGSSCYLFADGLCAGPQSQAIRYPGSPNVIPLLRSRVVSSFRCYKDVA